jgi:flotillin
LRATEIAQADADAQRVRIQAQAAAEAEALRITKTAQAQAEGIRQINNAIRDGGEAYLRYRQLEMVPQIAPSIAEALSQAKLVTISNGENGAPAQATSHIADVIQTVLAAQLMAREQPLETRVAPNGSTPV